MANNEQASSEGVFLGKPFEGHPGDLDRFWLHPDVMTMWQSEVQEAATSLHEAVGVAMVAPSGIGKSRGFTEHLALRLIEEDTPPWQVYNFRVNDAHKEGYSAYNPYDREPDELTTVSDMGGPESKGENRAAPPDSPSAFILDEVGQVRDDPTRLQRWLKAFKRLETTPVLILPTQAPEPIAEWVQAEANQTATELTIIKPGHKRLPTTAVRDFLTAAGSEPGLIDFFADPENSALRQPRLFSFALLPRLLYLEHFSDRAPTEGEANHVHYPHIASLNGLRNFLAETRLHLQTEYEQREVLVKAGTGRVPAITVNGIESFWAEGLATTEEVRLLARNLGVEYPNAERRRYIYEATAPLRAAREE